MTVFKLPNGVQMVKDYPELMWQINDDEAQGRKQEIRRLVLCRMCGSTGSAQNPLGYSAPGIPFMGVWCCHKRFRPEYDHGRYFHYQPPGRETYSNVTVRGPVQVLELRFLHHFPRHHILGVDIIVRSIAEFQVSQKEFNPPIRPTHHLDEVWDTWTSDMGKVGDLFRVLLNTIKEHDYVRRMPLIPRSCQDPSQFHRMNARQLLITAPRPWSTLLPPERQMHTRNFLMKKFSLDKRAECMVPWNPRLRKARCDAGWRGFWMTDVELEEVLGAMLPTFLSP